MFSIVGVKPFLSRRIILQPSTNEGPQESLRETDSSSPSPKHLFSPEGELFTPSEGMRKPVEEGKGGLSVHFTGLILRIRKTKNRSWFEMHRKYLKDLEVRWCWGGKLEKKDRTKIIYWI